MTERMRGTQESAAPSLRDENTAVAAGMVSREWTSAQAALQEAGRKGLEKGIAEGLEQGEAEGRRRAQSEAKPVLEELEALGARLGELYARQEPEPEAAVFELAKQLAAIALKTDDAAFLNLFRKAARHIGRTQAATLRAGPRGSSLAQSSPAAFKARLHGLEELDVVNEGDDGHCVLETPLGTVDASIDVQFGRAEAIVMPENREG